MLKRDVLREVNEATDRAEAMPYPTGADLYTHVHEGPGSHGSSFTAERPR